MDDDMKVMLDEINKLTLKTIRESQDYKEFLRNFGPDPERESSNGSSD